MQTHLSRIVPPYFSKSASAFFFRSQSCFQIDLRGALRLNILCDQRSRASLLFLLSNRARLNPRVCDERPVAVHVNLSAMRMLTSA